MRKGYSVPRGFWWIENYKLINTNLKFCARNHNMSCALEKIKIAEVSGYLSERVNLINVFHGVNLISYTVTSIYPRAKILLERYQCFFSENLALFTRYQHPKHPKEHKNRISETTRLKVTEDSRLRKAQRSQKAEKLGWYVKRLERKEKKKCSTEEIDWYIMWK